MPAEAAVMPASAEPEFWFRVRTPEPATATRVHPVEALVPRVAVLGIGNVLTGDDAFGPFVARSIDARYEMPDGVEVRDIGTPGLDLVPHLAGIEHVIVVDTVKAAAEPGSLRCYRAADLTARGPSARTNPHQPTLADTLFFLDVQDLAPRDVLLVGVVPLRYDTGAPLSAHVRAAVPDAIALVVRELERLGFPPAPRERPMTPDIWWER
jgi:hydrogenase maturation protease